ncbi:glycosyltransferase [Aureibaculum marinum]|uniref:Glycosyltransferase n=1 Tax=Aureibaculum marinum TaxID=2487930 RepID=A0A3N4NWY6_9FLAO|nr:glycosyltransferase [Aureibaculum marinum]RPD97516.1 glycosyltransferase [Aureibaculum marinum]
MPCVNKKKILVAPLNWGLGHASRCIPIIEALIANNLTPVLASDGDALNLLRKEFPTLKSYQLPSYNIKYSAGNSQKTQLLLVSATVIKASIKERKVVEKIHKEEGLSGIISDNRFGVRLKEIPSVYITHQINVFSGKTTVITSKVHQNIIAKFDECWVPDNINSQFSGDLSLIKNSKLKVRYIGAISRFKKKNIPKKYDLLIVLSGAEPQRSLLEEILIEKIKKYQKKIMFVRGVFSDKKPPIIANHVATANYMLSKDLEEVINESEVILARSGYSTILDLAKLNKKAFFIPTPGQYEQEYLAERMSKLNLAPYASQDNFNIEKLALAYTFKGLKSTTEVDKINSDLFKLF